MANWRRVLGGLAVAAAVQIAGGQAALADGAPVLYPCPQLKDGDRVIFFGDSITFQGGQNPSGFVCLFSDTLNKHTSVKVIDAGVPGNTSADLTKRVDKDVLARDPSIVVIYIGINDVWRHDHGSGLTKEAYRANLISLIEKMTAKGIAVVLCTPTTIGEQRENHLDSLLDDFVATAITVGAEEKVPVIDLHKACRIYLAEHNRQNLANGVLTHDGVHMNETGNWLIAEQLLKAFGEKQLPPKPPEPNAKAKERSAAPEKNAAAEKRATQEKSAAPEKNATQENVAAPKASR